MTFERRELVCGYQVGVEPDTLSFYPRTYDRAERIHSFLARVFFYLFCGAFLFLVNLFPPISSGCMRVIAPTLLALILVSSLACSGSPQPNSTDPNSLQANSDQWQPGTSIPGIFRRNLVGDPTQHGPFKYQLRIPGGARAAVHRHSKDVHVKVLSGSMFIIIGEPLESSRARRFAAGDAFVVPADSWHDEWWDEETVLEAEGVGPMETIYKSQVRIGNDARRNIGSSDVQALYLATIDDAHVDLYDK